MNAGPRRNWQELTGICSNWQGVAGIGRNWPTVANSEPFGATRGAFWCQRLLNGSAWLRNGSNWLQRLPNCSKMAPNLKPKSSNKPPKTVLQFCTHILLFLCSVLDRVKPQKTGFRVESCRIPHVHSSRFLFRNVQKYVQGQKPP